MAGDVLTRPLDLFKWPTGHYTELALWCFSVPGSTQPFLPDHLINLALIDKRGSLLNTQHSFHSEIRIVAPSKKMYLTTVSSKVFAAPPDDMPHIVVIHV